MQVSGVQLYSYDIGVLSWVLLIHNLVWTRVGSYLVCILRSGLCWPLG